MYSIKVILVFLVVQVYAELKFKLIPADQDFEVSHQLMQGFTPYNQQIAGPLTYISKPCGATYNDQIIVTQLTKNCTKNQLLQGAGNPKLIILIDYHDKEEQIQQNVYCPILVIHQEQGAKIKDLLLEGNQILKIDFQLEQALTPTIDLVINGIPEDIAALQTLSQLNNSVGFVLKPYYLYETNLMCKLFSEKCKKRCLCKSKYCGKNFDEYNITGVQIMMENLKQICIWKEYDQVMYLNYMIQFYGTCIATQLGTEMAQCSTNVSDALKLDEQKIQTCVNTSFTSNDYLTNGENTILEAQEIGTNVEEVSQQLLLINEELFYGDTQVFDIEQQKHLTPNNSAVFFGICAGYYLQPNQCQGKLDETIEASDDQIHTWMIVLSVIVAIVSSAFICLYIKRRSVPLPPANNPMPTQYIDLVSRNNSQYS